MVSTSAISSIEWLIENAVRENSKIESIDTLLVTPKDEVDVTASTKNLKLIAINISSYIFRIVLLGEFEKDNNTVSFLSKILGRPEKELEGHALLDACGEFINLICGSINRNLSTEFRHVGMSTPIFIDRICSAHLQILKPDLIRSFEFCINQSAKFQITLCVCVAKQTKLDFTIDRSVKNDNSTGVLELF